MMPNPYQIRQERDILESEKNKEAEQQQSPPDDFFSQFNVVDKNKQPQTTTNKESDDFFSQFNVVKEKTPLKKEDLSFGKALSFQLRSYNPEDYKAFTPFLSGASLGLSEKIPGLEVPKDMPKEFVNLMENIGSVAPIELLFFLNKPVQMLAQKAPWAKNQVTALARIVQSGMVGAEYEALKEGIKEGEIPPVDDILEHGAEWAAIDAGLQLLGTAGRFGKNLLGLSRETNKPSREILNNVIEKMKKSGEDFSKPELVSAKAMTILEDMQQAAKPKETPREVSVKVKEAEKPGKVDVKFEEQQNLANDLKTRNVSDRTFDKLERGYEEPSKPEFKTESEAEADLLKPTENEEALNAYEKREPTTQNVGKKIKGSVESKLEEAQKVYEKDYAVARSAAKETVDNVRDVGKIAFDKLKKLEKYATKPEGYNTVIKQLENVLNDVGYAIERTDGKISGISLIKGHVTKVADLMELGKRLNKIVDYDILEGGIKDELKEVVKAVKSKIRNTLEKKNRVAYDAWVKAEKKYGETAEKFGSDTIRKIRKAEITEKIPAHSLQPTVVDELKSILDKNQYKVIEREILDNLNQKKIQDAVSYYREMQDKLSPEAKNLGRKIIDSKKPLTKETPKYNEVVADRVINEISSGKRPTTSINYWKTKQGNKEIRQALKNNPNKEKIIEYLQKQTMYDFASEFIDSSGQINYKKFTEALKKDTNLNVIKDIGGQDAVNLFKEIATKRNYLDKQAEFFNKNIQKDFTTWRTKKEAYDKMKSSLEKAKTTKEKEYFKSKADKFKEQKRLADEKIKDRYGEQILKRMARSDNPIQYKINDIMEGIGVPGKTLLGMLGLYKIGAIQTGGILLGGKLLYKLASKPSVRSKFRNIFKITDQSPAKFNATLRSLNSELNED